MNKTSFHILRVGMAITFIWIGILILMNPEAWGGYIMPWASELLPMSIREAMIGTGVADIIIGVLLLFNIFTWFASLAGTIHLVVVLVTSGINEGTVRDIGLLAGVISLMAETLPQNIVDKLKLKKKEVM